MFFVDFLKIVNPLHQPIKKKESMKNSPDQRHPDFSFDIYLITPWW